MQSTEAPYQRIVARIRAAIAAGELRPGDRVPSTRELMREYGVAMATATKALSALRQEGLVEPRPGVGTVVARRPRARPVAAPEGPSPVDRVVGTGIRLADADGLAALSMRRLAAALGLPTMTLYRHVAGKEELLLLMTDAVFAEAPLPELPQPAAGGAGLPPDRARHAAGGAGLPPDRARPDRARHPAGGTPTPEHARHTAGGTLAPEHARHTAGGTLAPEHARHTAGDTTPPEHGRTVPAAGGTPVPEQATPAPEQARHAAGDTMPPEHGRTVPAAGGAPVAERARHAAGDTATPEGGRTATGGAPGQQRTRTAAGSGWRARLETSARLQWGVYRRHPWAAEVMSFTRPPMAANAMAHTEWNLATLEAAGLPLPIAMHATMMLSNHVRGTAVNLEWEANAEQDTGVDNVEWFTAQEARFARITAGGRFPAFLRLAAMGPDAVDYELDTLFEFGLARLLDGLSALIPNRP